MGRGEGGLCCTFAPRACPSRVQKYLGQVDGGHSDNLCCCSQGDGDNRHMWFCWLIKHETGAKPAGLRRRGLTWPDQRMSPSGKSDSQTVQTAILYIQYIHTYRPVQIEEPPQVAGAHDGGRSHRLGKAGKLGPISQLPHPACHDKLARPATTVTTATTQCHLPANNSSSLFINNNQSQPSQLGFDSSVSHRPLH